MGKWIQGHNENAGFAHRENRDPEGDSDPGGVAIFRIESVNENVHGKLFL